MVPARLTGSPTLCELCGGCADSLCECVPDGTKLTVRDVVGNFGSTEEITSRCFEREFVAACSGRDGDGNSGDGNSEDRDSADDNNSPDFFRVFFLVVVTTDDSRETETVSAGEDVADGVSEMTSSSQVGVSPGAPVGITSNGSALLAACTMARSSCDWRPSALDNGGDEDGDAA
eukprot:Gregarina_sp_Poly_1__3444@NODE_19_length_21533_cov_161_091167_g17_i0_p15_GENE_NODE_19_length_21533_cov_161_091167_g17_i0NODE_19_length_21533_cov_161_091167_g17_i0_p15_ORF_typecomplete_len175_score29_22_NODE_19_length_21533_cov_161_091167_g17_i01836418888